MATLKQLQNFLVLAEELHFARAAETLGISQSALSNEIKKLEKSVGCQLFDRSDRWMIKLTDAGQIYLRKIKDIPVAMDNAKQLARKAARGESGTLSIAVAGLIYANLDIGNLCREMLLRYPEVKLRIYDTLVSPATADLVLSGKCDIGFYATSNPGLIPERLGFKKLTMINLTLAIPATNPLAYKKELKIEDLKNSHFIFPPAEEAPRMRKHFEAVFLKHCNTLPLVVHEVAGVSGSLQLVGAGLGIALIPRPLGSVVDKNVVLREIPLGIERFTIAAWDENNSSMVLRNFVSLLAEKFQS